MFLRKIKDIRISNNTISVIRDASVLIEDLEDQIGLLKYSPVTGDKNKNTENAKIPPFIQVFYYLFFSNLKIPTEIDFFETYINWIGTGNQKKVTIQNQEFEIEGIKERMNRTYPSLIRDLHFLYLLEKSKRFDQVDYSMERDYYNGLDIKLNYKGKSYFVSLFIDTARGRYFKQKKTLRHNNEEIIEIVFSVEFNSLTKRGAIYLLNDKHIEILEDKIKESLIM